MEGSTAIYLICSGDKELADAEAYSVENSHTTVLMDKTKYGQVLSSHLKDMSEYEGKIYGYIDGSKNFETFVTELKGLGYGYSVTKSRATSSLNFHLNGKLDGKPYSCGNPYTLGRTTYYQCVKGVKYYKTKSNDLSTELTHADGRKRRSSLRPTKKIGCPAELIVKQITVYPEYRKGKNWRENCKFVRQLKEALLSSNPPSCIERFLISISDAASHNHSEISSSMDQTIHTELKDKIYELAKNNVTSVKEIKVHLEALVDEKFRNSNVKPGYQNTGFYPTDKVIYSHVIRARRRKRRAIQEAMSECVSEWQADDDSSELLFSKEIDVVDVEFPVIIGEEGNPSSKKPKQTVPKMAELKKSCLQELETLKTYTLECTDERTLESTLWSLQGMRVKMDTFLCAGLSQPITDKLENNKKIL